VGSLIGGAALGGAAVTLTIPSIVITPLLLVPVSLSAVDVQTTNAKPIRTVTTHPDFIAPPPSLNEAMLSTDLIVRGRIIGSVPRDKTHAANRGIWIRSGHRVEVLEVFLAPAGVDVEAREITVIQTGGDRDRGDHIERLTTASFPLLENGKEYVLFLERADVSDWGSAYGPDGVFENMNGQVHPIGTSELSVRLRTRPWPEFLVLLRNLGVGGTRAPVPPAHTERPGSSRTCSLANKKRKAVLSCGREGAAAVHGFGSRSRGRRAYGGGAGGELV
jgi:hypothetical protein